MRPHATVVALLLCVCSGCGDGPIAAADGDCREQVADLLHFGLDTPEDTLADAERDRFVGAEITPRSPAGLTVLEAHRQWRGRDGRIEPSSCTPASDRGTPATRFRSATAAVRP